MQFKALFGLAGLLATLPFVTAGNSTSLSKCGPSPKVLSTKKIPYKDTEAVITTYNCPSIVKRDTILEEHAKRQTDVCGVACSTECINFPDPTPMELDCVNLGNALEQNSATFLSFSGTVTTVTLGTCETAWVNQSEDEFEYCIDDWGSIISQITLDCIPAFSGAQCVQTTESWLIEVFG